MNRSVSELSSKLKENLDVIHLEIKDQSEQHRHHAEGGSGHYELTIVSSSFRNQTKIQQHRAVYQALAEQMGTEIHALKINTLTPEEWREK